MMHKKLILVGLLSASAMVASAASAQTLTFDNLVDTYGDGAALGPNMTSNRKTLTYTEAGYVLSLITDNAAGGTEFDFPGAHIGDGTGVSGTFNWHDGIDNQPGAFVQLTRVGGGLFNLTSFSYSSSSGLTVTPSTGVPLVFLPGSGTSAGFSNISFVNFFGTGDNQIDDLAVTAVGTPGAVPEPATWAMMLAGFGAVGFAMRRRGQVRTSVTYA